ncbi:MAG: hypothetical protein ETSY1_12200 [Candidatus Entotheonella factor]|uniref:Uncharacterized protein n=1 Tax=Entotheonella factor TaxID=1429438 RepID=W4LQ16_ENTF1|nr:MAG: hypothetical protein ETSY1_12200 [Candidatus Entotheonella factor]
MQHGLKTLRRLHTGRIGFKFGSGLDVVTPLAQKLDDLLINRIDRLADIIHAGTLVW